MFGWGTPECWFCVPIYSLSSKSSYHHTKCFNSWVRECKNLYMLSHTNNLVTSWSHCLAHGFNMCMWICLLPFSFSLLFFFHVLSLLLLSFLFFFLCIFITLSNLTSQTIMLLTRQHSLNINCVPGTLHTLFHIIIIIFLLNIMTRT